MARGPHPRPASQRNLSGFLDAFKAALLRVAGGLELIPAQPSVHRNNRSGNIARKRRGEEYRQHCKILRLAPVAHRYLFLGKTGAVVLRIVTPDLLAHDTSRRN